MGKDGEMNGIELSEALAIDERATARAAEQVDDETLSKDPGEADAISEGVERRPIPHGAVIIHTPEETIWEALSGHGPDFKRLPRSEWDLLLGIASTAFAGILQGELGRLVQQDKRSVPKRTDSLVEKGYAAKRTTSIRGMKTSKLWLKALAPKLPQESLMKTEGSMDMVFSRTHLVDNLEPVPWHSRWSQDIIDYSALASTVMALCKSWEVIRLNDLKAKLGVIGKRWQMKIVSKLCRFLNARGAIQYVAARLENRVFKDCIRFERDMTARDWSMYLATGKRATKSDSRATAESKTDAAVGVGSTAISDRALQTQITAHCPIWDQDIPFVVGVERILRHFGLDGSYNLHFCFLTMGVHFTRYISSITSALSVADVQPIHLSHLAVHCEHQRQGKIASFRYFQKPLANGRSHSVSWLYSTDGATTGPPLIPYDKKNTLSRIIGLVCKDSSKTSTRQEQRHQADVTAANRNSEVQEFTPPKQVEPETTTESQLPAGRKRGRPKSTKLIAEQQSSSDTRAGLENRKWICEKCGGSWKNDIGLKYHVEKSKTPCNPNFVAAASNAKMPKTALTLGSQQLSIDESRSYQARGILYTKLLQKNPPPAQHRNRLAATPKPPIVLGDDCLNLDWKYPTLVPFAAVLPVHNISAKKRVQGGFLVGLTEPRGVASIRPRNRDSNIDQGLNRASAEATKTEQTQLVELPDISEYPELASDSEQATKGPSRTVAETIRALLERFQGALPGLPSLHTLILKHGAEFSLPQTATIADIETAIKKLIKSREIVTHWQRFRSKSGTIAKLQILTLPNIDFHSSVVASLVDEMKSVYPEPLYQPANTERVETAPPSTPSTRRSLGNGVAVLDAPVYAAQVDARRKQHVPDSNSPKSLKPIERILKGSKRDLSRGYSSPTTAKRSRQAKNNVYGLSVLIDVPSIMQSRGMTHNARLESSWLGKLVDGAKWKMDSSQKPPKQTLTWYRSESYSSSQREYGGFAKLIRECSHLEALHPALALNPRQTGHQLAFFTITGGTSRPLEDQTISWAPNAQFKQQSFMHAVDLHGSDEEYFDDELIPEERVPLQTLAHQQRSALATRRLKSIARYSRDTSKMDEILLASPLIHHEEVLAGFIAVRTLLGGSEKSIDWGILLQIFPDYSLIGLRQFWARARKDHASLIAKTTENFQHNVIDAFAANQLPLIDYDDIENYDWGRVVSWTAELFSRQRCAIPRSRQVLTQTYSLVDDELGEDDWKERFFHPQSSIFARFDAATSECAAVPVHPITPSANAKDMSIARSWIRAICITSDTVYSAQELRQQLDQLPVQTPNANAVLKLAVDELIKEKVICKAKRGPSQQKSYRLNESYLSLLAKLSQSQKFDEAASFKERLDISFRSKKSMRVPFSLDDGSTMALLNMQASGRIKVSGTNVPYIPLGFEPGNYESRKLSKSSFHFDVEVRPTTSYKYNEDIGPLKGIQHAAIPLKGPCGQLPQWVDIFQALNNARWQQILEAASFMLSTRGSMSLEGFRHALSPVLEEFEAKLVMQWGHDTGILRFENNQCHVAEWWWLIASK